MIERVSNDRYKRSRWRCLCTCGETTIVSSGHLRTGHTKSCRHCRKNVYQIEEDKSVCKIFSGEEVLFDTEDYHKISKYTWCIDNYGYAKTTTKEGKTLKMHQLMLASLNVKKHIDHINGNKLDNRKENLRLVTNQQNLCNQKLSKANTSGYKGVSFNKRKGKYAAYITNKGKRIHLGYYTTPKEAAFVYNKAASFYFGEYARLNLIGGEFSEAQILELG